MIRAEYRLTVRDQSWVIDLADLDVGDWIAMERASGLRRRELGIEIAQWSALAVKTVVWLCRRLDGESRLAFDDVRFKLYEFKVEELNIDTGESAGGSGDGGSEDPPVPPATAGSPTT